MATYALGDLQGCADALDRMLDALRFDVQEDRLWFVGDLVNRGPESLRTLRTVKALKEAAVVVLGNHDLHLLALAAGAKRPHSADTLGEILDAPDAADLIDWLRRRPLAHLEVVGDEPILMVHAGLLPSWSVKEGCERAHEVEVVLAGSGWQEFMGLMYGDEPLRWDPLLTGPRRLRMIVNAFTRLRFCTQDGLLDLQTKEGAGQAPEGYMPWFEIPDRKAESHTIVFGHWSTLGLVNRPHVLGLDTGCVWGGSLTAVRLEDRVLTQVACPQYRVPG
ncbi:MAG: symmetrical bis(5'-nucleosyl)-tetraphosphatase [Burkholderiaceae bacterium]|jgi:bis(5'-nucleosyl)-tetraphosphatase (symmetrical)